MKFRITAKEGQIKEMCKDLDDEKDKLARAQSSTKYKMASRLMQAIIGTPMMVLMDYRKINQRSIELSVTTTAQAYIKERKIAEMIMKRARQYGSGVDVKVL